MRSALVAGVLALASLAGAAGTEKRLRRAERAPAAGGGVVELTSDDFMAEFRDGLTQPTVVEFFSPTCPHCVEFAPTYSEFAQGEKGVRVARVDGKQHSEVVSQFGVSSFPTVKFFPKGYATSSGFPGLTFNQDRSVENLHAWVEGVRHKDVQQLQTMN